MRLDLEISWARSAAVASMDDELPGKITRCSIGIASN